MECKLISSQGCLTIIPVSENLQRIIVYFSGIFYMYIL